MDIKDKLTALRSFMEKRSLAAYIVPSTDPHSGEYVPEHWEARKWISGFTGSAGTAVIGREQAGLWTDSRYFLQAEEQLKGTEFILFKDRLPETPSIPEWLGSILPSGSIVGIDGEVNATCDVMQLEQQLAQYGIGLQATEDPFRQIWTDRPELPTSIPFILPTSYSGESCRDKLTRIRNAYQLKEADGLLLSALDEVAWTLNMRGDDVHCNPVFVSYLLITDELAILYINKVKVNREMEIYLAEEGVIIRDYKEVGNDLSSYPGKCLLLPSATNYWLYRAASRQANVLLAASPVQLLKAIKNATEIKGFRQAMRKDGIAMVKFLRWLKEAVQHGTETEVSIDERLLQYRQEQEGFKGISFDTIAGYQEHGAIVHYEATPTTAASLRAEGLLLLDSGGQYLEGTTDITRTIVLGPVSEEQIKDYTLVLKGMIALSSAVFPAGTCGTQLDVLARQFMWREGINYGHGTGHGVGHFLNVHEGPHQIRMNNMPALLQPGMTVTNEPGIYKAGRYGIRIENTMLITEKCQTEFGTYYQFEPLTLCPIDREAIDRKSLTQEEKDWLNDYHERVFNELSPGLTKEEQEWLAEATQKI